MESKQNLDRIYALCHLLEMIELGEGHVKLKYKKPEPNSVVAETEAASSFETSEQTFYITRL
jgi:hypothetical protein